MPRQSDFVKPGTRRCDRPSISPAAGRIDSASHASRSWSSANADCASVIRVHLIRSQPALRTLDRTDVQHNENRLRRDLTRDVV